MTTNNWDFSTPSEYTISDSGAIEVLGGSGRLIDNYPASLMFYASYNSSLTADYTVGTAVPYSSLRVGVDSSIKKLGGGSCKFNIGGSGNVRYNNVCSNINLVGTYSCYIYFVNVYASAGLFTIDNALDLNNLIDCRYLNSPNRVYLGVYDSSGILSFDSSINWTPSNSTWYHIELDFDFNTGETRLFIDGVQLGDTITNTASRNAVAFVRFGASGTTNYYLDNVLLYNTVLHTSNFTPPLVELSTKYSSNNPFLQPIGSFDPVTVGGWDGLSHTLEGGSTGSIGYILSSDNGATWDYYNSGWQYGVGDSTHYNTITEINDNIATWSGSPDLFLWRAYLISDGTQPVGIDNIALDYTAIISIETRYLGAIIELLRTNNRYIFSDLFLEKFEKIYLNTLIQLLRENNIYLSGDLSLEKVIGNYLSSDVLLEETIRYFLSSVMGLTYANSYFLSSNVDLMSQTPLLKYLLSELFLIYKNHRYLFSDFDLLYGNHKYLSSKITIVDYIPPQNTSGIYQRLSNIFAQVG